jgi:thioredoxin 1
MSDELTVTKDNFEAEVLQSPIPVLLDFWAAWCPPCRGLAPTIEQLATEYKGRVKVGKVDVDSQPELATQFGVVSIPTLIVFNGGKAVATKVGANPNAKAEIVGLFKNLI